MQEPDFDCHISVTAEPILIKLETKNYHPKGSYMQNYYLDLTSWVVWANTQFATVRVKEWFQNVPHKSNMADGCRLEKSPYFDQFSRFLHQMIGTCANMIDLDLYSIL